MDVSKYSLSAKISEELIDSSAIFGFELLPDFEDLWNKKFYYNNEAIICNYIERSEKRHRYNGKNIIIPKIPGNGTQAFGINSKTKLLLLKNPSPEIKFYNNFPKGYRKDVTFFTTVYVYPVSYLPDLDTGFVYINEINCKLRAAYRKFLIDTLLFPNSYPFHIDEISYDLTGCPRLYLIRYAQTLLTFAEASARAGNLNEKAYDCINKIRRRANKLPLDSPSVYDLTPGLSPEAFADSVAQERAWELAGETGHRWFDMVRLGIVEKVFQERDPHDGKPFVYTDNDKYFFPIPEHDINLNPNLGE